MGRTDGRRSTVWGEIVEHVDVLVGNEEDLQKGLGIAGPQVAAKSKLDPSAFVDMMARVVSRFPNIKIVATTLREVHSTNRHEWSAVAWIEASFTSHRTNASSTCSIASGAATASRSPLLRSDVQRLSTDEAVRLGWAHGRSEFTTFPGDTTMATLDQVQAVAQGGSAAHRGASV